MKKINTILSLVVGMLVSANALAVDLPPVLNAGSRLNPGDNMISYNKVYQLSMQSDSNIVIYRRTYLENVDGRLYERSWVTRFDSAWSVGKAPFAGASYAVMQADGNFVRYSKFPIMKKDVITFAANDGKMVPNQYKLVLGEDGSLTIRDQQGAISQRIYTDFASIDDFSIFSYPLCSGGIYKERYFAAGGEFANQWAWKTNSVICPNGFPPGMLPGR
jgi:hypothetical protein